MDNLSRASMLVALNHRDRSWMGLLSSAVVGGNVGAGKWADTLFCRKGASHTRNLAVLRGYAAPVHKATGLTSVMMSSISIY